MGSCDGCVDWEMVAVTGLELVAGYAVGYLLQKWRRVAGRVDTEVDHALDTGMDRMHELISTKLVGDTALARLEAQASVGDEKPRTRERVEGAIIDAAEDDPDFAQQLEQLVTQLREHDAGASTGDYGVAAGRDMNIRAKSGGVAAGVIHGSVTPGNPPQPGKAPGLTLPGKPAAEPHIVAGKVVYSDRGAIAVGELHSTRRAEPARPIRLDSRPASLAGREHVLAELATRLPAEEGARPRVAVLHGMGGVGKTSVALEYAHLHLDDYGLIWQFSAEDPVTLSANFAELATLLGVRDLVDGADPVHQVHAALAARPGRWLLLMDNVIDPGALRAVMPPAGNGHVLVTSQNPHWPGEQAVAVPVLDHESAAAFLLSHTNDTDTEAARQLATELGGLPLALEQVAAYLNATGESLRSYSELFNKTRASLLTRGGPSGYDKTVTTTWALAFAQLHATEPTAITLLRLLACYAPEDIPYRLLLTTNPAPRVFLDAKAGDLLSPLLNDILAVGDAVAALRRYSLTSPAIRGTVSVHRLIQAVTADELGDTEYATWRRIATAVLEAALPDTPEHPDTWPIYMALLPHILALSAGSTSMMKAVRYLGASGDYRTAGLLQQNILANTEDRLGAEHPDTLTARADLAYYTGEAGDPAGARDICAALLPLRETVVGAEHPDTLATRNNLAHWTGDAGDRASARDQYAALLPIQEKVLGAEHPDTLHARHQFARWTGDAGDPVAARDALAPLLVIQEKVLGAEHPATLTTRANLAWYTGEAGDPATARDGHAALLPVRKRVLGPEHPDTLITWASHADWTGEAGDPVAARDSYAALLPIREKVLGVEHPRTLTTRHELAHWTGEAGDAVAARDSLVVLLPIRERIIGAEHPHTLLTRHELARWTGEAGDPVAARDALAALLPIQEKVVGATHPHSLITRKELDHWTDVAPVSTFSWEFLTKASQRYRSSGS